MGAAVWNAWLVILAMALVTLFLYLLDSDAWQSAAHHATSPTRTLDIAPVLMPVRTELERRLSVAVAACGQQRLVLAAQLAPLSVQDVSSMENELRKCL